MKKLLIIIVILSLITIIGLAKLSDETLKTVEELRWKHYGYWGLFITDINNCLVSTTNSNIEWIEYDYWTMTFEDGKLFIETQDGKWFIELKEVVK